MQSSSEIKKTILDVPVSSGTMDDQPDTPLTTISEVIGPSEALEQEAASRQMTAQARQDREEASRQKRSRQHHSRAGQHPGWKRHFTSRNRGAQYPPTQNQPLHIPEINVQRANEYQWQFNQIAHQHQTTSQAPAPQAQQQQQQQQQYYRSTSNQNQFQAPAGNRPLEYGPQHGPRIPGACYSNFGSDNQYPFAWQQPSMTFRPPPPSPLVPSPTTVIAAAEQAALAYREKNHFKAAVEDEYDRSRGAYFGKLPPPTEMRMGAPKRGVAQFGRTNVVSMKADIDQVDAATPVGEEEGTMDRSAPTGRLVVEGHGSPPEQWQEGQARMEKKMGEIIERLDLLNENVARLVEVLGGTSGGAMSSEGVERWWKEMKEGK